MVSLARRGGGRSSENRTFDWTRHQAPGAATTDFQRTVRDHVDWTKSPLGPLAEWPSSLRQMVLLSISDSSASAVLYGPGEETAIVYNEAFANLIGSKHPRLQGQALRNELADLCPELASVWARQASSGLSETIQNQRRRQDRLGFVEEKTYAWKFVPIMDGHGSIAGSLVTVDEENKQLPRRERSKSAVREFGNVIRGAIDHTTRSALMLEEHFSGKSCNCEKLWQATQRMENNKAKYAKFADCAPVGIAALERTAFSLEWANKAYFDIMGQPPDSRSLLSYIHPEDLDQVRGHFELGAFREGPFTFECRLKKLTSRPAVSPSEAPPQPSPAWILVSAYREADMEQETMCWIIDITAHKSAEEFLRKRMDEALEMQQQKERFIDMISHEVRNPLSAMMHCTDDIIENARHDTADAENSVQESAQTIAYCTQHIRNIVGDVLTLSKLDSRLVEVCPVPSKPQQLMRNALRIFQGELRKDEIHLSFHEDPSLEELRVQWLVLDPNRVLQILINFITNAIKILKGRARREITVRLSASARAPWEETDAIQCVRPRQVSRVVDFGAAHNHEPSIFLTTSVEDSGPGLEPDELSSLFERFAQANPKTESKYGGSGLGLFISRDLTELHGGRIGITSTPGVGSTFVFSIEAKRTMPPTTPPRLPVLEIPTQLREPSTSYSPVTTISSAMRTLHSPGVTRAQQQQQQDKPSPRRVLVVEDNLINQKVLVNQLRKRGYDVSAALHGEEALDLLRMEFEVVLMDIEMPVMDGITCVQHIRAWERTQHAHIHAHASSSGGGGGNPPSHRLPIIAVTANARSEHGRAAIEAGMDAITTKPYKIEDLVRQIEEVCSTPSS